MMPARDEDQVARESTRRENARPFLRFVVGLAMTTFLTGAMMGSIGLLASDVVGLLALSLLLAVVLGTIAFAFALPVDWWIIGLWCGCVVGTFVPGLVLMLSLAFDFARP